MDVQLAEYDTGHFSSIFIDQSSPENTDHFCQRQPQEAEREEMLKLEDLDIPARD